MLGGPSGPSSLRGTQEELSAHLPQTRPWQWGRGGGTGRGEDRRGGVFRIPGGGGGGAGGGVRSGGGGIGAGGEPLGGILSSANLGGALSIRPTGARKALVLWSSPAETPILWPPDVKN